MSSFELTLARVLVVIAALAASSCETNETLYCPSSSAGGGSAGSNRCDSTWDGCGPDREAVLFQTFDDWSSLTVSCDGDHCVCRQGERIERFDQPRACEALRSGSATSFVEEHCGWDVEYLNTMDPEVQFIEDAFAWAGACMVAFTTLALGGLFGLVRRRRRRAREDDA